MNLFDPNAPHRAGMGRLWLYVQGYGSWSFCRLASPKRKKEEVITALREAARQ